MTNGLLFPALLMFFTDSLSLVLGHDWYLLFDRGKARLVAAHLRHSRLVMSILLVLSGLVDH